jgi:hypothetical protein
MTFRALAIFPFAFVAVAGAVLAAVPEAAHADVLRVEIELVKLLALAGLSAGALAFERGEYLRRGWGLNAACYFFLLARDVWLVAASDAPLMSVQIGRALLIFAGNASAVVGTWTLARAWSVAGLVHPGPRGARWVAYAVASAVALLLAGPPLYDDVRKIVTGESTLYSAIPSDLGDLLALPLLAPVALTAIAVRGGKLRWPWGLLTLSLAAWLLYDAFLAMPDLFHLSGGGLRFAAELFRFLAASSACAAGLAQRLAVK